MSARTVYIVLFRGVGGDTRLPPAMLRQVLTEAGFGNVATYINTGNAVVSSNGNAQQVVTEIAAITRERLGFTKDILVASLAEWSDLVAGNPFPDAPAQPSDFHAYLLQREPAEEAVAALAAKAVGNERFAIRNRVLYLFSPDGASNSKLASKVEKTLDVVASARNWNTVLKLRDIAQEAENG